MKCFQFNLKEICDVDTKLGETLWLVYHSLMISKKFVTLFSNL